MKKLITLIIASLIVMSGCSSSPKVTPSTSPSLSPSPKVEQPKPAILPTPSPSPKVEQPTASPKAKEESTVTMGQKNALSAAVNYLGVMPFSYSGLIAQLEYEKFSNEDATYAADNCGADWNEQAAKSARNYLDIMAFSRDSLIDQLKYEGYTNNQAEYAATEAGY